MAAHKQLLLDICLLRESSDDDIFTSSKMLTRTGSPFNLPYETITEKKTTNKTEIENC